MGGPGAAWTIKKIVSLIVLSGLGKATASYKTVYQLVRRLGFRWKRGVKRLNRIDPVARAEFAERIQRFVDEANRGERTLIYLDEAHIHCDLDEGYGWAWGGEPYEIPSSSPGLSKKVSLYGAFVFNDPEIVIWKAPRCNTMFTLGFLFQLARAVAGKPKPTIVWDGAPWHKPLYMRSIAEKVLGFELVLLPAYSPDFMPVEALWRWLREEVTRNRCHDAVEELVGDVIEFGKRLNADPLGLIRRLWPKLELRVNERPPDTQDLEEAPPEAEVVGWREEVRVAGLRETEEDAGTTGEPQAGVARNPASTIPRSSLGIDDHAFASPEERLLDLDWLPEPEDLLELSDWELMLEGLTHLEPAALQPRRATSPAVAAAR